MKKNHPVEVKENVSVDLKHRYEVVDFIALFAALFTALSIFIPPLFNNSHQVVGFSTVLFGNGTLNGAPILLVGYLLPLIAGILHIFRKRSRLLGQIAFALLLISVVILLTGSFLFNYFNSEIETGFAVGIGIIVATIGSLVGLFTSLRESLGELRLTVRDMAEMALLIGLALVLDQFAKIKINAGAGSINFGMLPLFLIAFRYSFAKSWLSIGVVFGLVSCLIDGYGFASYPFDYFLAYGSISFVSLFRSLVFPDDNKTVKFRHLLFFAVAIIVGTIGRYLGSTLSSVVLYGTTFVGGLVYNWYILLSGLITMVLLYLLYKPFLIIRARFPSSEQRLG